MEIGVVANSIVRVYHNERQKERHAIWSLRDLEVSMHLKGLRRVVSVTIWTRSCEGKCGTKKNEGSKSLDQGDKRDEGGTYTNCEKLCSEGAKGAMKTGHGIAKCERRIWWIGWRQWFGWKKWTCSKWRHKDSVGETQERRNQRLTTFGPTTSLFSFLAHVGGCAFGGGGCHDV